MDEAAEEGSMERTLAWDDGAVEAIDQCAMPAVYRTLRLTSVDDVIDAIVRLAIRGAPAIGVADGLASFAPVSTHTQTLVTNLLSDAGRVAEFLAESRRRLRASATAAMDLLDAGGIGYLKPAGGFSLWIDPHPYLPTVSAAAELALWQRILRSARVNIPPGTAYACPEPGWFRLCHATDAGTVATGITRLIRALETS